VSERAPTFYAWLSVATSIVTIVLKFAAYFLTGSVGLLSDAIEAVVNIVAALVALDGPSASFDETVAVALAAGHLVRQGAEHAGAHAAQVFESGDHLGQFPLHHGPPAGQHEVELAELVHPAAVPPLPQVPGPAARARGVSFQDGDLVPVAGQQHARGQAVEPGPHHDNLCHLSSPRNPAP